MLKRPAFVLTLTLTLIAAGCSGPGAVASPTQRLAPLPTTGFIDSCASVGLDGPVNLVDQGEKVFGRFPSGGTVEVFWPVGFKAVFDPEFNSVVRANGSLFATAGEDIYPEMEAGKWHETKICGTLQGIYVFY
jgi:hypothetical protein